MGKWSHAGIQARGTDRRICAHVRVDAAAGCVAGRGTPRIRHGAHHRAASRNRSDSRSGCVPVVAVRSRVRRSMAVPGLLKHFTTADINALICPRAHLSLAGVYDRLTPPAGLHRVDAALQQVYADAGVPERWQLVRYSSGHFETWDMRPAHLRSQDGRGLVGKSGRLTAVSE